MSGLAYSLQKTQGRPTGQKSARVFTYPAPVDGLNKNSAIADMKITEALVLENLVCKEGGIALRYGVSVGDQISGPSTSSLYGWTPSPYGVNEMYVVGNNGIYAYNYDTAAWSTKAAIGTTVGGFMMTTWFSTTTDTFLICNGGPSTGVFTYSPSTGYVNRDATLVHGSFDSTQCAGMGSHAERLFFWESTGTSLFYLATAAVTGTLTELPIGPFLNKGGKILGVKSWTRDGGDGLDDYFCIFTTNGEVVIYQGYDPDDPDNWQKVGTFDIGQPITQTPGLFARHVMKVGADIGVLTKRGLAMLSQLAQTNESGHKKISVTYKISADYQRAVDATTSLTLETLWSVCEYPRENLIIINSPDQTTPANSQQLVVNVNTGGWSRWTGIIVMRGMMACDLVKGGLRMLKSTGDAMSYNTGFYLDGGGGISWKMQTAFSNLKTMLNKNVSMVRPHVYGAGVGFMPIIEIKSNFDPSAFNSSSGQRTDLGLSNNVGGGAAFNNQRWASCPAEGVTFSICLSGTSGEEMTINGIDVLYEISDIL